MTALALIALLGGCVIAVLLGNRLTWTGMAKFVGATFLAIVLGIGMTMVTALAYSVCNGLLKVCVATTDTTIYDITYPLMAVPVYWIILLVLSGAPAHESQP
ncbi:MAG: hypothetical protein ACJ8GW_18485 [Massilia sp.]